MKCILDKNMESFIQDYLVKSNKSYNFLSKTPVTVDDLDSIFENNQRVRENSTKESVENLGASISLANLVTHAIVTLTCSVYSEEEDNSFLPKQWIDISGKPDPKHVFGFSLTQLCQLAISIVDLTERGLDNPARVVLRSFIELSWQTIILLYYREDLKKYVVPEESDEVNKVWWELFGRGKIQKKLATIEKEVNIPDLWREKHKEQRKDLFQFFSESVHHSNINSLVSAFTWSFDGETGAWSALGGASLRSDPTLTTLASTGIYFLDMFISILVEYHGSQLNEKYKDSIVVMECAREILMKRQQFK